MSIKAVALLAWAAVAFAHPQRHHHHHHGTGGTGGGFVMPTGGPFSPPNGTNPDAFGAGSSSVTVTTFTVSPLPATDAPAAAPSTPVAAIGDAIPVAPAPSLTSCSTTMTTTVTSIDYATVTVNDDTATSAPAVQDFSPQTSDDSVPSVSAAAFFGRPSGGSFSYGGYNSQSFAPTSFATFATPAASVGGGSPVASSIPSQSAAPITGGGTSGGKKGLSYNDASLTDAFSSAGISWAYNWGSSAGGTILSGAEYVPMLWGSGQTSGWSSAAQAAISSGSTHVLSFNEPDLSTQSNLSPQVAAQLHIANMGGISAQVGSPAITNGNSQNPPMGIPWLQQFFTACAGQCKVDFVAFHYYADTDLPTFQNHVTDVISAAAAQGISQVWLTEFGATGSDSDVAAFITAADAWLETQPAVARYAYFMCGDGTLLSGSGLSAQGQAYAA